MTTKVRGDFDFGSLTVELVAQIDGLRQQQGDAPISGEVLQLLKAGKFAVSLNKIIDTSAVIFKADSRDAVELFNIIFELIDHTPGDNGNTELCLKIVDIVRDSDAGADVRLAVFANLFNAAFLAQDLDDVRFVVLRTLVKFAAANDKMANVESFLHGTTEIFASLAKQPLTTRQQVLLDVYEALHKYEEPHLEQTYLIEYLSTFNGVPDKIDSGVQSLACVAIGSSIGNVLAAKGRQLLNLEAVKSLASAGGSKAKLFALLGIFNDGLLPDYLKFSEENAAVLKEFNIDSDEALKSMRLLSLCSACSAAENGSLSYERAAEQMGLEPNNYAELERWVMLAINNGLVDVKMCQQTNKIIVYASTQRNFEAKQWKSMAKKLARWRTQIHKLLVTVSKIRSVHGTKGRSLR